MTDPTKPDASPAADTSLSQLRHDFCTPINQILGYSQMLQEDAEELGNAKLTEDLRKIEAAGKRLLEMVDKLVSGARRATDTAPVSESPSKSLPEPAVLEQPGTSRSARARLLVVDDQEMKFRALREDRAELTISVADEANLVSADATQKIVAPEGTVVLAKPPAETTVVLGTAPAEGTVVPQQPAESTVMLDPDKR